LPPCIANQEEEQHPCIDAGVATMEDEKSVHRYSEHRLCIASHYMAIRP